MRRFKRVWLGCAGCLWLGTASAHGVVVRGVVRDSQGRVVPGARVQLILGQRTASYAMSGADGSFEIRDGDSGRFILLTAAYSFAPQISESFYGGQTDVVEQPVFLSPTEVRTEVSVTATGLATPLEQLTAPIGFVARDQLALRVGVTSEMRMMPGVNVVQQGQWGGVGSLFVHGGGSDATKVLVDGVEATDVGGAFDFGTVSSTGFAGPGTGAGVEVYRGANSATAGTDALAGIVALSTPRGSEQRAVLNYSGDAGNLHSYRNEAIVSGAFASGVLSRLDYLAGFSRFDTSNALPHDQFHTTTGMGNVGFALTARTPLRVTVRNADSDNGLPDAYDFHHIAASGRQADQDLYGAATVENTTKFAWHNLLRYGIARKREQAESFVPLGEAVTTDGATTYYGLPTTIRGANGYFASGQAAFYPPGEQRVSNRDELFYGSDYAMKSFAVNFGFRYVEERGRFKADSADEVLARRNFDYSLGVQGTLRGRLFYSFAGGVEKNHLFGLKGTPRVGLAYQLIRPSSQPLRGTRLRASAATGVQEPSLALEYASLYRQLLSAGDTAAIAQYGVVPAGALRSRTLDLGVDQNVLGEVLVLHAGVFHNQFSHQFDFVDAGTLLKDFGIATTLDGAELNSLAYQAEGAEAELDFQATRRLLARAGYTYLATRVEQSFSTDAAAAANGVPIENPTLPGIAIGATSPLLGGRVFRRPPHTGFAMLAYTGDRFGGTLEAAAVSRADDSTFLSYSDRTGGNTLLLPNRDLDFGSVKLDLGITYALRRRVTAFAQLDNLLNNQHIGPIGYPALPLTVRGGLKVRIGGYSAN